MASKADAVLICRVPSSIAVCGCVGVPHVIGHMEWIIESLT